MLKANTRLRRRMFPALQKPLRSALPYLMVIGCSQMGNTSLSSSALRMSRCLIFNLSLSRMKRLSIIPLAVLAVTPLTRVTAQEAVGSAARRIRTLVKPALQQLRRPEVVGTVLMILLGMILLYLLVMTPVARRH